MELFPSPDGSCAVVVAGSPPINQYVIEQLIICADATFLVFRVLSHVVNGFVGATFNGHPNLSSENPSSRALRFGRKRIHNGRMVINVGASIFVYDIFVGQITTLAIVEPQI